MKRMLQIMFSALMTISLCSLFILLKWELKHVDPCVHSHSRVNVSELPLHWINFLYTATPLDPVKPTAITGSPTMFFEDVFVILKLFFLERKIK